METIIQTINNLEINTFAFISVISMVVAFFCLFSMVFTLTKYTEENNPIKTTITIEVICFFAAVVCMIVFGVLA